MSIPIEHELFLLLAQFRNPNKQRIEEILSQKIDVVEVLGHLTYNRTAGIAYHALRKINAPFFNREFETPLYLIHQIQALRTKSHNKYITDIAKSMNASGIPHAFLKGSILANSIYPKGCRISSDIDILLNGDHLTECGKIFKELGFVQGFHDENANVVVEATRRELVNYRMNFGEVVPYRKVVDEPGINLIEIDINFSLDWMPHGTEQAVKNFIEGAELYKFEDGTKVSALPKEFFLAHLCVHLYKEARVITWVEWQRDLGFYKFVDIYGFLTEPSSAINWDSFIQIITDNNIIEECYYSLEYARIFFSVLNEDEGFIGMLNRIKPASTSYLEEVIDGANPEISYRWKKDLLTRFFDMKRIHLLEKNEV